MYLFIHAAERENAFVALAGKSKEFYKNKEVKKSKEFYKFLTPDIFLTFKRRITTHGKKPPDVLIGIDLLLKKFNVKPRDLKGICVLSGPGQFSFLRSSVVTANTFGWVLRIPVSGIESSEFNTENEFVEKGLKKLNRKKRFQPIVPAYGKEPNITMPRLLLFPRT